MSSFFLQVVYAIYPELLLEGDDKYIFQLFSKLVLVLVKSGSLSDAESTSETEEFVTYVVDVRFRHSSSGRKAGDSTDVVE